MVPLPFSITPEKAVDVLSPPVVKVTDPAALLVTVPAPAKEPMVSLKVFKSYVAPEDTVRALEFEITVDPLFFSVPALIVVAPVYVLVPESVNVVLLVVAGGEVTIGCAGASVFNPFTRSVNVPVLVAEVVFT